MVTVLSFILFMGMLDALLIGITAPTVLWDVTGIGANILSIAGMFASGIWFHCQPGMSEH